LKNWMFGKELLGDKELNKSIHHRGHEEHRGRD
jgi:hypothetical protein